MSKNEQGFADYGVFILRGQPFHQGHLFNIERLLEKAKRGIILIGSAHRPRDTQNPFKYEERKDMILGSVAPAARHLLDIYPIDDSNYNLNHWIEDCRSVVGESVKNHTPLLKRPDIRLVGHAKDRTSYYLNLFPDWPGINTPAFSQLSGTEIRDHLFHNHPELGNVQQWLQQNRSLMPEATLRFLLEFIHTPDYAELVKEGDYIDNNHKIWASAPYTPTFDTVDAVVVQSGHLLMVQRKNFPGRGLWALPGGYLEPEETLKESMLRELKEETRIKVPGAVLLGHITSMEVFDTPHRSTRGRVITHAFLIHLPPGSLPKIASQDKDGEVSNTRWIPLDLMNPEECFEDHYAIAHKMLGMI